MSGGLESECAKVCLAIRDKLINNFGVPPEQLNCTDGKWQLDCEACKQLLDHEWGIGTPQGYCER
jgi:hypothetical protein